MATLGLPHPPVYTRTHADPARVRGHVSVGGCFDAELQRWATGLLEDFRQRRFRPVLSDVTAAEVLAAADPVRELHAELLDLGAEVLPVTHEALALRASYLARGVLGSRFENDMLHIAVA